MQKKRKKLILTTALSSIKKGLWTLFCHIFLATGIQHERRDNVDLLDDLLGMPSMREIEALARPPPPQQPELFTFQPLIFRYDGPAQPDFPTFPKRSPPHFGSWTLPAPTPSSSPTITRTPPSRNQQGPTRIQRLRLRMRRFIYRPPVRMATRVGEYFYQSFCVLDRS